jgi:uncharacterized protein YciI
MSESKYFLCRLIPPRPSFAADMSATEREAMQKHAKYLREQLDRGKLIVFGPVADPKGPWGLAVASVRDEQELREMLDGDPVIHARLGLKYESYPMLAAVFARPNPANSAG